MKICIVGAGAVGGLVGANFARAGADLTLVDVGPHLDAIRANGLRVVMRDGDERTVQPVLATARLEEVPPQDLVVLALKAQDIQQVAADLPPLLLKDGLLLHIQNGLPWWYFQRHGGPFDGRRMEALDPTGIITESIDPERILGCVPFPASRVSAPGVVRHVEGNRFPVGELDGRTTDRAGAVAELFTRAGFKSFVIEDIRSEIWLKLWGNMSFNPISALTHATMEEICQVPSSRELVHALMSEAQQIAERLGIRFRVPIEKRIAGAEKVGGHKTSTLQDVEAGRAMEIEALLGAPMELGRLVGVPTPHMDTVYACAKLLEEVIVRHKVGVRARPM